MTMAPAGGHTTKRRPATLRARWRDAIRDTTHPTIDAHAVAVAMALDRHMDADGRTHTGVRALAALARVSKNTVTDRIARLEHAGFLTVTRPENGGSSRYQATITDPDRPTLWDTPQGEDSPVDNGQVSHPMGHPPSHPMGQSPNGTVPPRGSDRPTPRDRPSHGVGLTPVDPVKNPEGEVSHDAHTNDTRRVIDHHPLTVDHIVRAFAQHLTGLGRRNTTEIRDHVDLLVTHVAQTTAGPGTALTDIAIRIDDLAPTHRRRWARELAHDLYPDHTPPTARPPGPSW